NLVSEGLAEAMNITCIDAPAGCNELILAQLTTAASVNVKPPRIASAPVAFECRLATSLSFGSNQAVIFGQILSAFVDDSVVLNAPRGMVETPELRLVGAMHGARWYS